MRTKKAVQIMFDDQVTLENAPKRVVIRRDETDEDAVLMLEMLLDDRKMRFQLRNHLFDFFDISHLRLPGHDGLTHNPKGRRIKFGLTCRVGAEN